jgi:hypothetical protein
MAVLGDLIAATHGLLVTAVAVGTVCSLTGYLSKNRRLENAYLSLVVAVIVSQMMYGDCVLTRWEKAARNRYSPGSAYRESFLAHYLPFFPHLFYVWVGPIFVLCGLVCVFVRRIARQAK